MARLILPQGCSSIPGRAAIAAQDPEQQMVLPFAGNAKIFAGVAFLLEPGPGEQRAAGKVARQTGSLEPVQPEALEGKVDDERQRGCHIALARKGLAHPVAQARRLRNAAPDIRQAYAADQGLVMSEDKKIIS